MSNNPTPINQPRSPMATGSPEQKARFDALQMCLDKGAQMDAALDGAHYVTTGELPEEDS